MDPKVRQALALLKEAGRLDLVAPEAFGAGCPVRRASAGVAAAVAACSPPRSTGREKVSALGGRAGEEAGRVSSRAGRGRARGSGLAGEAPRASPKARQGKRARAGVLKPRRGPIVRCYGARHGAAPHFQLKEGRGQQGHLRGHGEGAASGTRYINKKGAVTACGRPGRKGGEEGKNGTVGNEEQRDPKVPISKRWPTMLVWSSSDEERGPGGEGDAESASEGPSSAMVSRAHGRVFVPRGGSPSQEEEGSSEEGEVVGQQLGESQGMESGLFPGTPDLFELGPLDFDGDDSGEHGAALLPWEEEKGSPRAANRMSSTGRRGRRGRAADAFSRLCGGVGDTPPGTAAWEEQRLGSIKTWGYDSDYAGGARGCEKQQPPRDVKRESEWMTVRTQIFDGEAPLNGKFTTMRRE
ncbi:hypothetical protein NDU88_006813 [Pleurodeles waltl]|uniref:Uncharacterized protein n=1 Tax=Pleurodeles waltl TaxID=8319 RepID=A0AAV7MGU8_PLEWA|nr:hypothetical protein NDU88_006813 [Pleurodeles waltl]